MPRFMVYLGRPATDHLRAELVVDAPDADAAKAQALAAINDEPEVLEWRFGECGEQGDPTAYDAAQLADDERTGDALAINEPDGRGVGIVKDGTVVAGTIRHDGTDYGIGDDLPDGWDAPPTPPAPRRVLSTLAHDRCTAFALEAIEARLSPSDVALGTLTDHERNVLAAHIRAGLAEAFASNYGAEHAR